MKSRLMYFGLVAIVLIIIISFTTSTQTASASNTTAKFAGKIRIQKGVTFQYANDGSIRSIESKEKKEGHYLKTFEYRTGSVTTKETLNGKLRKQESVKLTDGVVVASELVLFDTDGKSLAKYEMSYRYNTAGNIESIVFGNGSHHDFVYDNHGDLESEKWYDENGEIVATAKKQYFPPLPDELSYFNKLSTSNRYAAFFPPFSGQQDDLSKLVLKVKEEISFDGNLAYLMTKEGYVKKGKYSL